MTEEFSFTILGMDCEYTIDATSTHETLYVNGHCVCDASGEVGIYRSSEWRKTIGLKGAALEAVRERLTREHVEHLLSQTFLDYVNGEMMS